MFLTFTLRARIDDHFGVISNDDEATMRFNPVKFREQRELLTYTQDKLAHEAKVSVRTVQRAEGGLPVRAESMADLAAALRLPVKELLLSEGDEPSVSVSAGEIVTLKRATSGRAVLELLESTGMCRIDCDIDPTPEIFPLLKEAISLIEANMPDPLDWEKLVWPPRTSLITRLELIAGLNGVIAKLADTGAGIFIGKRVENAVVPRYGDEGFYTRNNQRPEAIMGARVLISATSADKLVVDAKTQWPIDVVYEKPRGFGASAFDDDLDEDVPF